jgi:hypothetical protein
MGAHFGGQGLAVDAARTTHHDVSAHVELVVELAHLFGGDGVDDVSDTVGGVAEVVVLCYCINTLKAV